MITLSLHTLAYFVYFFGVINLIRMFLFRLGADRFKTLAPKILDSRRLPSLSVIIPAHNEQGTIIRAIRSVVENGFPPDKLECIVVNNNSTDHTKALVKAYLLNRPYLPLTLLNETTPGKAHALNTGFKAATGEVVMCLDADSYLHPGALKQAATPFALDPSLVALAANVKITPKKGLLNLIQQFEYLVCYQMKRAEYHFNINYIIGGIGSTFRRQTVQALGYYDTNTVTEDIDLTFKLLTQGNLTQKIAYAPEVIAYTEHVPDIKSLIRQRFRWKWGRYQTFYKNSSLFFSRHPYLSRPLSWLYLPYALFGDVAFLLEPILLSYILFVSIYFKDPLTLLSALLLLTTYNLLNIWGEDTLTARSKLKYSLLAPIMYLLLYAISLAEYAALIKSLFKFPTLKNSIDGQDCSWTHVARAAT
jgi:poly-beta-1,6-N-acetyl-D-glucosamine synthase